MTTNFFQNIASLNTPGNWKIGIRVDENGEIHIVGNFNILKNSKAGKDIPPFTMKAPAEEMDRRFFETIANPIIETAAFLHNMKDYNKGLEKAKSQSKPAVAKPAVADGEQPDAEIPDQKPEKKKAYEQSMKTISDLQANCKYQEALDILPAIADYPDKEKELKNLKTDLTRKKDQLNQIKLL